MDDNKDSSSMDLRSNGDASSTNDDKDLRSNGDASSKDDDKDSSDKANPNPGEIEKFASWDLSGKVSRMMARMKYDKSKGLGVHGQGIKQPIEPSLRPKKLGLGCYMGFKSLDDPLSRTSSPGPSSPPPQSPEPMPSNYKKKNMILKENKGKKEADFKKPFKHIPPKALDEDEIEFLDTLEMSKREYERRIVDEDEEKLRSFKAAVTARSAIRHELPPPAPTTRVEKPTGKRTLPFKVVIKPKPQPKKVGKPASQINVSEDSAKANVKLEMSEREYERRLADEEEEKHRCFKEPTGKNVIATEENKGISENGKPASQINVSEDSTKANVTPVAIQAGLVLVSYSDDSEDDD